MLSYRYFISPVNQNIGSHQSRISQQSGIHILRLFPEPQSYSFGGDAIKVPGLDGSGKMGKSEGNAIYLIDDAATIRKKVMKAVTDSGPTQPNSEKPEAIANLFTMLKNIFCRILRLFQ